MIAILHPPSPPLEPIRDGPQLLLQVGTGTIAFAFSTASAVVLIGSNDGVLKLGDLVCASQFGEGSNRWTDLVKGGGWHWLTGQTTITFCDTQDPYDNATRAEAQAWAKASIK